MTMRKGIIVGVDRANIFPGQYVLVDANVLQHAGSRLPTKAEAVIMCLEQFASDGFQLAVSEYTVFENLHGLWGKKADEAVSFLALFQRFAITSPILTVAAALGGLYHDEGIDMVSAGDKILAATALLENGLILTGNHRDFMPPFFHTVQSLPLAYTKQHYTQHLDLAVYALNTSLIDRRIAEKERV